MLNPTPCPLTLRARAAPAVAPLPVGPTEAAPKRKRKAGDQAAARSKQRSKAPRKRMNATSIPDQPTHRRTIAPAAWIDIGSCISCSIGRPQSRCASPLEPGVDASLFHPLLLRFRAFVAANFELSAACPFWGMPQRWAGLFASTLPRRGL